MLFNNLINIYWQLLSGIGIQFSHDSRSGTWAVQEILDNFCVSQSDMDAAFPASLMPGDEIIKVPNSLFFLRRRKNGSYNRVHKKY